MKYLIFNILIIISTMVYSQENNIIIDKNKFYSYDFILKDSKENVLNKIGNIERIDLIRFSIIDTIYNDAFINNSLVETYRYEFSDKGLWYYIDGDTLKLQMIDFGKKINKKKKIYYKDICFDRNLEMKDVISFFNLIEEKDYSLSPIDGQFYYPFTKSDQKYYLIHFIFPDITLVFDYRSKKLRCIDFGHDNGGVDPIKIDNTWYLSE